MIKLFEEFEATPSDEYRCVKRFPPEDPLARPGDVFKWHPLESNLTCVKGGNVGMEISITDESELYGYFEKIR